MQGVGFRPFVHRLPSELALAGFVGNDAAGVVAELEGESTDLDCFLRRLLAEPPPLARIESLVVDDMEACAEHGFRIIASASGEGPRTLVPPDVATCDACLVDVHDAADRRYRYPFTNCTNCGPRFTIIRDLPYDRPATTMAGFDMCEACTAEYTDPDDRRFHAQPIACPTCGPQLSFESATTTVLGNDLVLEAVQRELAEGRIVAIKGLGGYHLACDATNDDAVRRLRRRKGRGRQALRRDGLRPRRCGTTRRADSCRGGDRSPNRPVRSCSSVDVTMRSSQTRWHQGTHGWE